MTGERIICLSSTAMLIRPPRDAGATNLGQIRDFRPYASTVARATVEMAPADEEIEAKQPGTGGGLRASRPTIVTMGTGCEVSANTGRRVSLCPAATRSRIAIIGPRPELAFGRTAGRTLGAVKMCRVNSLVDEAWSRIVAWLAINAPTTAARVNPPATDKSIADAQRAVEQSLPADLVQWWYRADGVETLMDQGSVLPPFFLPCSVERALREWRMLLEVYGDPDLGGLVARDAGQVLPAGSRGLQFLPSFVPIAFDGTGGNLIVDLRSGDLHGCVMAFHPEVGTEHPLWGGIAEMLDDVADAIEHGTPTAAGYLAVTRGDGRLDWALPDRRTRPQ
jgi:cell wall assembly regulator SMI1